MENKPEITISRSDVAEIEYQITQQGLPEELTSALEDEISRATLVANNALPKDVVAIGSQVTFKVLETNNVFTKTLCLPTDINKYEDAISIFAPIGSAIIGLRVGQRINWQVQRANQTVEIISVAQ
ncbi:GreA/GreB family elongation factor [Thalassotalea sp. 1_MG-2023]|uniref:GreA/GreB family elongation factor n=1 Tax=Thalassotalea sp. 1_MG-2023 TaxID=3062680 RepID=UPI0026E1D45B|nr:GreA/GreB family elongation factor [Thalassotalea sp. 1_MG-2023]MDO6426369.1 GreA/GreB family elongation factor [Thalassotalea sp. 1_MG-2023]